MKWIAFHLIWLTFRNRRCLKMKTKHTHMYLFVIKVPALFFLQHWTIQPNGTSIPSMRSSTHSVIKNYKNISNNKVYVYQCLMHTVNYIVYIQLHFNSHPDPFLASLSCLPHHAHPSILISLHSIIKWTVSIFVWMLVSYLTKLQNWKSNFHLFPYHSRDTIFAVSFPTRLLYAYFY